MYRIKILNILLIIFSFLFSCNQMIGEEWEILFEYSIHDGVVFSENNRIFFIEPLEVHYESRKIDLVGYKKNELLFDQDSKIKSKNIQNRWTSTNERLNVMQNLLCEECSDFIQKKVSLYDFAYSKTKYKDYFRYMGSKKIIDEIPIFNQVLKIYVLKDGLYTKLEFNLYNKSNNTYKYFEAYGSLMFVELKNDLLVIGIMDWGGSGHTASIYIFNAK